LPFSFGLESRKSEDVWSEVGRTSSWSMNGAGAAGVEEVVGGVMVVFSTGFCGAVPTLAIGSNFPPNGLLAGKEDAAGFAGTGGGTCGVAGFATGAGAGVMTGRETGVAEIGFAAEELFPVDHPAPEAIGAGVTLAFGVVVDGTELILLIEIGAGAAPGADFAMSEGPMS
jgi:hypothetical protein